MANQFNLKRIPFPTQLDPLQFARFKSLNETACTPVHIAKNDGFSIRIKPSDSFRTPQYARLPREILEEAREIAEREKEKLRPKGLEWLDGDKVAVSSFCSREQEMEIGISLLKWSWILATHNLSLDHIVNCGAIRLGTNTHLTAIDNGRPVLVIAERGKKPGDPRMGDVVFADNGKTQLTLAVNGGIDAEVFYEADEFSVWKANSRKESLEELGVDAGDPCYLGLMLDQTLFKGDLGILGIIRTNLTPLEIERLRRVAIHSVEVGEIDILPLELDSIAKYFKLKRDKMTPQLITGLVILGYRLFGENFLKLADK